MPMTLDDIPRRNALRFPHRPALRMGDRSATWAELDARVDRLAGAMRAQGLRQGDRVAVLLGNCPEYLEIYFACARSGCIAVPVNYRLTAADALVLLRHARPALLISSVEYAATVDVLRGALGDSIVVWNVAKEGLRDARSYEAIIAAGDARPRESSATETDCFAIFYTSGTTGLPKGAMVSHLNLVANGYNQLIADAARADDVNLVATPLYHMGAVFMAVTYMMIGAPQIILPQFTPQAWLSALQRERATVSLLISTMINAVLNDPQADRADMSSLRLVFYGGGPMPPAVLKRAILRWNCGFTQGYGLTETLEATFLVAADHVLDDAPRRLERLASAGREAVGAEIRIVDDKGRDCETGAIGEVLVRSKSVIAGYWDAPDETAAAIRDGWFHTGDLGYLDEERYLFLVDRKKDMVISGGVNIYTKEIEAHLFAHPAVAEAAVFGLPDDHWGEIVCAAVVMKPDMTLDEPAIVAHCREGLAAFKKPKRVFFLDELPKNPSGKVLKRELRKALQG
ncbi:MAG: long-chain fatty acid--CoA ligase [Steroidobacteraceae bacterium]